MIKFFDTTISNKNLAIVMYAILRTGSKLINSHSIGIKQYTRKQSGGFSVDIVIDIPETNVNEFEELTGVKLKSSKEFQGTMIPNTSVDEAEAWENQREAMYNAWKEKQKDK